MITTLILASIPIIAVVVAIGMRNRYWIPAALIALLPVPILLQMYRNEVACRGGLGCFGDWLSAMIWTIVCGVTAIVLALLDPDAPSSRHKDPSGRRAFVVVLVLIPLLLMVLLDNLVRINAAIQSLFH